MTRGMAASTRRAEPLDVHQPTVQYAVAVRKNVQWISLIESPGHGFEPPELPECVVAAVHELSAATRAGAVDWVVPFCREAANILITGSKADQVAEAIAVHGAREKIVRCASRDDMQGVARVLALAGDYVVQGDEGMLIFPPWF